MWAMLAVAMLGQARPSGLGAAAPRAIRAGDVVRVDTGVPNSGVPAIRLWHPAGDGGPPRFAEVDYWAFCAAMGRDDPLDQLHFMEDRGAVEYAPNGTLLRVVAIHRDWGFGLLDGVPVAEV